MTTELTFRDPVWLWALLALPAALWLRRVRGVTVFLVPFAAAWHRPSGVRASWTVFAAIAGFALLTIALARPQRVNERVVTETKGYDLMLALDLSTSMLSEDYKRDGVRISRFDAVMPVLRKFIEARPNDRIGLVLFAGRAYTLAPLTFDHAWLLRQVERVRVGMIEDGTAIGDGVLVALQRLEQKSRVVGGQRKGAVIVLLTDGVNNSGLFTPREARELAAERRVVVHTVATGREGWVPVPYFDAAGQKFYREEKTQVDEEELWMMAMRTGGRFFRAHDQGTLRASFAAIDRLEKIEFESRRLVRTAELFPWLAVPGALLLFAAALAARPMWLRAAVA